MSAMIAGLLALAAVSARAEDAPAPGTPAPAPGSTPTAPGSTPAAETPVPAEDTLVFSDPMEGLDKDAPTGRLVSGDDKVKFEEGKVGNCAHFMAGGTIRYPKAVVPCEEGTMEMWLAFDESPDTFVKQKIPVLWPTIGYHHNSIELLFGGESDWGKQMLMKVCDKDAKRFNIDTSAADWKANEWHHVAMTWKFNAEGKSTIALYVDRKLVRQLIDQTIMMNMDAIKKPGADRETNYLWLNGAGATGGFKMDDLKIYKVKREYTE